MGQGIRNLLNTYLDDWYWPDMRITDLIEILIIAFLVYYVIFSNSTTCSASITPVF